MSNIFNKYRKEKNVHKPVIFFVDEHEQNDVIYNIDEVTASISNQYFAEEIKLSNEHVVNSLKQILAATHLSSKIV